MNKLKKRLIDSRCVCLTIPLSSPNRWIIAATQGGRALRRPFAEPVVAAAQLRDEDK
jgi:hypothetical protein